MREPGESAGSKVIACPRCRKGLRVRRRDLGRTLRCPRCRASMWTTAAEPTLVPLDDEPAAPAGRGAPPPGPAAERSLVDLQPVRPPSGAAARMRFHARGRSSHGKHAAAAAAALVVAGLAMLWLPGVATRPGPARSAATPPTTPAVAERGPATDPAAADAPTPRAGAGRRASEEPEHARPEPTRSDPDKSGPPMRIAGDPPPQWKPAEGARTRAILASADQPDHVALLRGSQIGDLKILNGASLPLASPDLSQPGSLWLVAEGGLPWTRVTYESGRPSVENTRLIEGRIYQLDGRGQPQPTAAGDFAVWVTIAGDSTLYPGRDEKGPAPATLVDGSRARLLVPGRSDSDWHHVRVEGPAAIEGWLRGASWSRVQFLRSPTATAPAAPSPGPKGPEPTPEPTKAEPDRDDPEPPAPKADEPGSRDRKSPTRTKTSNWPRSRGRYLGFNEVTIVNESDADVKVGLRFRGYGPDLVVPAHDSRAVGVSNGTFRLYYKFSDEPDALYESQSANIFNDNVTINLHKTNGESNLRRVK